MRIPRRVQANCLLDKGFRVSNGTREADGVLAREEDGGPRHPLRRLHRLRRDLPAPSATRTPAPATRLPAFREDHPGWLCGCSPESPNARAGHAG